MEEQTRFKALVGLGNPGAQYRHNRHNIGFRVVDELANRYSAEWRSKDNLEYADITIEDSEVLLIKPQTYMNDSGNIMPFLRKRGIEPGQILVIHDELEKPFGSLAVRLGGSHRGHNGLRSLITASGGDFWRLRVGISRPDDKTQVPQYVLSDFKETPEQVTQLIAKAADLIEQHYS